MNRQIKANIFDIQKFSTVDGPGIRTTVFFKGCNLRCEWCHNPESQEMFSEMLFRKNRCIGCGKCVELCPHHMEKCELCGVCTQYCPQHAREIAGRMYTVEEVFEEIEMDKLFYDTSGGGVTFSGGECMLQIDFLEQILKKCKLAGIHTAVDTAGCVAWEKFEKILPYTDMFLYDVKCYTDALHTKGTGVSNRTIIQNLQRLSSNSSSEIIVRIPIIPGFNADKEELALVADFLKPLRLRAVELLPYHKTGEQKYEELNKKAIPFEVPTETDMKTYKQIFGL